MKLSTRVFELYKGKYRSLPELARVMGISGGYIYKVRQGKRSINQKFIIGAIKAFPGYKLDDLFYVTPQGGQNNSDKILNIAKRPSPSSDSSPDGCRASPSADALFSSGYLSFHSLYVCHLYYYRCSSTNP